MHKSAARILIVDDDPDVQTAARVVLKQHFPQIFTESNHQRLAGLLQRERYDVIFLDMNFAAGNSTGNEGLFWLRQILAAQANTKVVLITAYADINLAVEGMKSGASDFIVKPWENDRIINVVSKLIAEKKEPPRLKQTLSEDRHPVFVSPPMRALKDTVDKVAPTDANILLLGENGTGKDVIAEYIHQYSLRNRAPFVKVDIASLPGSLLESELFGHKRGAFTDATADRLGRFESAQGGTLFLDEIGNISLENQSRLLTVLQSRKVTPVGSNETVDIDVRIISATNIAVGEAVAKGSFRQDLLYRLNTIELRVPSLRDRPEDIPILVEQFITYYSDRYQKEVRRVDGYALDSLIAYNWPGNVRELQHSIERAVIMSDDTVLQKKDFKFSSRAGIDITPVMNLDEMEHRAILGALEKHNGNLSKVARELGLGRTTLYRKMEKYNIQK